MELNDLFTPTQQYVLAFLPKPLAMISLAYSSKTIFSILRDSTRRIKVYHRLILAMMISIVIMSVSFTIGTLAMPRETGFLLAYGNNKTCNAQGFFILFSVLSTVQYYSLLALFSYIAIGCDFDEMNLRKYEPWFHWYVISFSFVISIIGTIEGFMNPSGAWCTVSMNNFDCNHYDCQDDRFSVYASVILLYWIATLIFTFSMIVAIFRLDKIKHDDNRVLRGKKKLIEEIRRQRSITTRKQAAIYCMTIFFCSVGGIITRSIHVMTTGLYFPSMVLSVVVACPIGMITSIVYNQTRLRKVKTSITEASCNSGQAKNTLATEIRSRIRMHNGGNVDNTNLQTDDFAKNNYSIFDGTRRPSSQFYDYFYSDDNESLGDSFGDIEVSEEKEKSKTPHIALQGKK